MVIPFPALAKLRRKLWIDDRSTSLPFETIALPDETLFPEIVKLRRFRCEGCGSKQAVVTPDWRMMNAPGMGRR